MITLSNQEYSAETLQLTRQSSYKRVAWGCGLFFHEGFCFLIANAKCI